MPLVLVLWGALQSVLAFGGGLATGSHTAQFLVGGTHDQRLALGLIGVASVLLFAWTHRLRRSREPTDLDHWGPMLQTLRRIATGS